MSLIEKEPPAFPESIYIAADIEWQVLLSMAIAANPSELVTTEEWYEELFASDGAKVAFQKLAHSDAPIILEAPASVDGVAPFENPTALQSARQMLVAFAQFRLLEIMQGNLAREVRRRATTRRTEGIGTLLETARSALHAVETLDGQVATNQMLIATLGELAASYWDRIAEQRHAASTGLGSLDTALGGGLQTKRLFVILGGPGSGKTTLVNLIAESVAASGRPVVYLTTEDPMSTLLAKTLARLGRIDYGAVLQGLASEQQSINNALHVLAERKSAERLLYIESDGVLLNDVFTLARQHFARFADEVLGGGAGVLVVDYLQRVARAQLSQQRASGMRDLREAVTSLTEQLRYLARDLNCTVIAVASQNRASGYANANAMTSAKESGDVEYTADVLMALGDEQRQAPLRCEARSLSLAKNRLGSQTMIHLDWRADRQQFTEATTS